MSSSTKTISSPRAHSAPRLRATERSSPSSRTSVTVASPDASESVAGGIEPSSTTISSYSFPSSPCCSPRAASVLRRRSGRLRVGTTTLSLGSAMVKCELQDPCRNADGGGEIRNIGRHHGVRSHDCVATDSDPGEDHRLSPNPRTVLDLHGARVAHTLILDGDVAVLGAVMAVVNLHSASDQHVLADPHRALGPDPEHSRH